MTRVVSIWLPAWPVTRLARAEPNAVPDDAPFALVAREARGLTIAAVNRRAARDGVSVGLALADARAAVPTLISRPAEPARDRAALVALARSAGRYGPNRNVDGDDGVWIDITGVAHLFGGEAGLISDMRRRLALAGIAARIGLADTLGAAHALARYAAGSGFAHGAVRPSATDGDGACAGFSPGDAVASQIRAKNPERNKNLPGDAVSAATIRPQGAGARRPGASAAPAQAVSAANIAVSETIQTRAALEALPVASLRIDAASCVVLRRLGLSRVGQLYDLPRDSLELRFRTVRQSKARDRANTAAIAAVLTRLDQALGHIAEPRRPLRELPVLSVVRTFAEPLISSAALETVTAELCAELCAALKSRDLGVRHLCLTLYRSDVTMTDVAIALSRADTSADRLVVLLGEKLTTIDAGFGVDLMRLEARRFGSASATQETFADSTGSTSDAAITATHDLVDRLSNRFGVDVVTVTTPRASHSPERAEHSVVAARALARYVPPWPYGSARGGVVRPPFLLSRPEPIRVLAEVPDGPPVRFTWRRVERRVKRSEGPERISPEWWRNLNATAAHKRPRPRDYYRIEDETGAAYWVFRHGLYNTQSDEADAAIVPPEWFLHGLFA